MRALVTEPSYPLSRWRERGHSPRLGTRRRSGKDSAAPTWGRMPSDSANWQPQHAKVLRVLCCQRLVARRHSPGHSSLCADGSRRHGRCLLGRDRLKGPLRGRPLLGRGRRGGFRRQGPQVLPGLRRRAAPAWRECRALPGRHDIRQLPLGARRRPFGSPAPQRAIRTCVIRRKTDTGSGAKRTTFRSCPDKVPAESGQLT